MDRQDKFNIISEGQVHGVTEVCRKYGISRTLYYRWLNRYQTYGLNGLDSMKSSTDPVNKTPAHIAEHVIMLIRSYPSYGPREVKYLLEEIGHKISESAVYNIMKRHDLSTKEKRIRFSKKKTHSAKVNLPDFETAKSGECWIFWITPYGHHRSSGPVYEYTIFDYKSRITCSRLYNRLSLDCFLDLLMAVAIPVAQSLNFTTRHLCFIEDALTEKNKSTFLTSIQETLHSSGFDITIHFLKEVQCPEVVSLKKAYTQHCLSFMTPFLHSERSFDEIKILLQRHIRNYNLMHKSDYGELRLSPIEYHSNATGSSRILPLWAYIDRLY